MFQLQINQVVNWKYEVEPINNQRSGSELVAGFRLVRLSSGDACLNYSRSSALSNDTVSVSSH